MNKAGLSEEIIKRRLKENSNIRILFLDPRSEIIPYIVKEDEKEIKTLFEYICKSISICKRLYNLIKDEEFGVQAKLEVRLFDEIPYFAYHKVNETAIIGFYLGFSSSPNAPAYEIADPNDNQIFEQTP